MYLIRKYFRVSSWKGGMRLTILKFDMLATRLRFSKMRLASFVSSILLSKSSLCVTSKFLGERRQVIVIQVTFLSRLPGSSCTVRVWPFLRLTHSLPVDVNDGYHEPHTQHEPAATRGIALLLHMCCSCASCASHLSDAKCWLQSCRCFEHPPFQI